MRNKVLTLIAAGLLLIALAFATERWCNLEPQATAPLDPQREESVRAQEIVDTVKQGRVGHARALADSFYRAYPNSPEIQSLERLTGYHPRPYGP
jgi:hypothetical protein